MLIEQPDVIRGARRIADYLGLAESRVRELARNRLLPIVEIGGELRMSRDEYWDFLTEQYRLDED